MSGPWRSQAEACAHLDKDNIYPDLEEEPAARLPAKGQYAAARFIACYAGPYSHHQLTITTARGLFIDERGLAGNMAGSGGWTGSVELRSLKYQTLGSGELVVVVRANSSSSAGGSSTGYFENADEQLMICGLNRQATPLCLDWLVVESRSKNSPNGKNQGYTLTAAVTPAGLLSIAARSGDVPPKSTALLGEHRLSFQ